MKLQLRFFAWLTLTLSACHKEPPTPPPITFDISAKAGLNLRKAPDLNAGVVTLIPYKASVVLIERTNVFTKIGGREDYWLKVSYNDNIGFVFGGFVEERLSTSSEPEKSRKDKFECNALPDITDLVNDRGKMFRRFPSDYKAGDFHGFCPNGINCGSTDFFKVNYRSPKHGCITVIEHIVGECSDSKNKAVQYVDFVAECTNIHDCVIRGNGGGGAIAILGEGYVNESTNAPEYNVAKAWVFDESTLRLAEVPPFAVACYDYCYKGSCN